MIEASQAERMTAVADLIVRALALRPMNCLAGIWPEGVTATVQPTDNRVRQLRVAPMANRHVATDRIGIFWGRDHVWSGLLREIMVRYLAGDEALRPIRLPELVARTGLSATSVYYAIRTAVETGDFTKVRSKYDKRVNILVPSLEMHEYFEQDIKDNLRVFAVFCGRPRLDPAHLGQVGGREFRRLMIRSMSLLPGQLSEEAAARAHRSFFYLMWDLLLEPELGGRGFVANMAKQMNVAFSTIARVVEHGRSEGWFEAGEALRPSAMARYRYAMMFTVFEARCNLLLDALEAVAAEPALAPALDPGMM